MTQYVNLSRSCYNSTGTYFDKVLLFDEGDQNCFLSNRAGLFIEGTDENDCYSNYAFTDGTIQGHGKATINDLGGTGDELSLDMYTSDCNFFIDFYADGDVEANSDLIIFNDTDKSALDGLYNYLGNNGHAYELDYISEYVQIKHGFSGNTYSGDGAIETISAYKEDGYEYGFY